MTPDLRSLARQFAINGHFREACPYGAGHINDTYRVTCDAGAGPARYILQRINHHVFKDPARLMENLLRVTAHLRQRLRAAGCTDLSRRVLRVIGTPDQTPYYQDPDGNFWRAFPFIEDATSVEVPDSLDPIRQAAKAFGRFEALLADLPGPPLHETIPDFHNGAKRYDAFLKVLAADPCNRAALARHEIDFLLRHAALPEAPAGLAGQGRIPVRVTHNDTKINNVLLDRTTGEGICVIDLDTVMPGLSLYDFGDIVRTAAGTAAEDEPDLAKVHLRMDRFEVIVHGFLAGAASSLNRCEVEHLVLGGQFMTLAQGLRFLTDFLQGDTYYKVHRPGHNLDRCRVQLRLVQHMIDHQEQMEQIVRRGAPSTPYGPTTSNPDSRPDCESPPTHTRNIPGSTT